MDMRVSGDAGDVGSVPQSDRQLKVVEPKDLPTVWPSIRTEVLQVESPDCIAEDCYAECKSAQASLFLLFVGGVRVGFVILKRIDNDLHIWQCFGINGHDVLTVFRPDLDKIARDGGMTKLTFGTVREGFERVAPKHRFRKRLTVWEADVI